MCTLLGAGGGVRIGGVQVSDYSMCMSRRWREGGVALCAVEGVGLVAAAVGWRILPLLCLTELHPPFISQTLRDGTPQVQIGSFIS